MRPLKDFDEFIKKGIIQKRMPDISRAKDLIKEAEKREKFVKQLLKKIGISNENANYFIENSYDILMELIRAKLFQKGFYASGEGAHEAGIAFMKKLHFSEKDTRFMNELRYYRKGILYYGKDFDAEYAKKVIKFLEKNYSKLTKH